MGRKGQALGWTAPSFKCHACKAISFGIACFQQWFEDYANDIVTFIFVFCFFSVARLFLTAQTKTNKGLQKMKASINVFLGRMSPPAGDSV